MFIEILFTTFKESQQNKYINQLIKMLIDLKKYTNNCPKLSIMISVV